MRTKILMLLTSIWLYSCKNNFDYIEIKESEFLENKNTLLQNTTTQKIYNSCKDYGAPLNDRCFLVIQKEHKFYKINPKYRYVLKKDYLYLFQTVSLDYAENGNWVLINKRTINGKENVSFKYDTIPSISVPLNSKGVFHLENGILQKVGELTTYKSLHDLSDTGFFYLSTPGLFYEKIIPINEIE